MSNRSKNNRPVRKIKHISSKCIINSLHEDDIYLKVEELDAPFILVIDGIQDAHNLGACLRSADAAGVDIVITPRKNNAGLTETVRRISCGAADNIPFIQVSNLNQVITKLSEIGVTIVGTGDANSQTIYEQDLTGPLAFIIGSEARGIHRKVAEKCDALVSLPMQGSVECLNLSVATGICLFEAVRQRL